MKKACTKALAILLATLLLLGACAVSAAAAPAKQRKDIPQAAAGKALKNGAKTLRAAGLEEDIEETEGTLTITQAPTNGTVQVFIGDDASWVEQFDLSGMVLQAEGGKLAAAEIFDFDAVTAPDYINTRTEGKINWYFDIWPDYEAQPDGWRIGENKAVLYFDGIQFSNFQAEKEIGGVPYGQYDEELVFWGTAPITLEGVEYVYENWLDAEANPLTLDIPAPASIRPPEWDQEPYQLFKFTAEESGCYALRSADASFGETLWNEEGGCIHLPDIDPYVYLIDGEGWILDYADDDLGNDECQLNFKLYFYLEEGESCFFAVSAYFGGDFTVVVNHVEPGTLAVPEELVIDYHEVIRWDDLILEETTWSMNDLDFRTGGKAVGYDWWYGLFYGAKIGKGFIEFRAPDGATARVKVTVKYTLQQWLCVIFLGGWGWMKYTRIGVPFSLKEEWALLREFGIFNALGNLIGNFFYSIATWFENLAYWFW